MCASPARAGRAIRRIAMSRPKMPRRSRRPILAGTGPTRSHRIGFSSRSLSFANCATIFVHISSRTTMDMARAFLQAQLTHLGPHGLLGILEEHRDLLDALAVLQAADQVTCR